MNIENLISGNKNKIVNIAVVLFAFIVAFKIYGKQQIDIANLKSVAELETKKNGVLGEIGLLEKKLGSLKRAINSKDVSLIMNSVGTVAKDNGVKVVSFKPQSEKDFPVYTKYSFDLLVSSSTYHKIAKFISVLESSPDIYMVESINIINSAVVNENPKIDVQLMLSTVLMKD